MSRIQGTLLTVFAVVPWLVAAATPGSESRLLPIVAGIAVGWAIIGGLLGWRTWIGILAASLMGVGVGMYLGLHHVQAAGSSICSVNETFNCDAVNQSKYAEVAGFPVAFLGMALYLGISVLSVVVLTRPAVVPRAGHAVLGLGVLSLAYSAFLFSVSMSLGVWCLFCISLYGVNILLTIGGFRAARGDEAPLLRSTLSALVFQDKSPALSIVATVFIVVAVGSKAVATSHPSSTLTGSGGTTAPAQPQDVKELYHPTPKAVALDGAEPLLGDPNARYTVVEFADFQCPYCSRIAPEMHDLVQASPDVKLMFKHYPISSDCNKNVPDPRHQFSCKAASAAECARQQGRFWELSRLMFLNQESLDDQGLVFMAKQANLDVDALQACLALPATLETIRGDVAAASDVEVDGTPSLFMKGGDGEAWWKIEGGPEALKQVLDASRSGTL